LKQLFDLLPVIIFFIAYKVYDIYTATAALMISAILQLVILKLKSIKIGKMQIFSVVFILLFGGVTLLLRDEMFLKWKVTVVNWIFFLVFIGSHFVGSKTIIERMLSGQLNIPAVALRKLNVGSAVFFLFLGVLNLYVVYFFDTNFWVNFKLFGLTGLTFIFVIAQALYIRKQLILSGYNPNQAPGNRLPGA